MLLVSTLAMFLLNMTLTPRPAEPGYSTQTIACSIHEDACCHQLTEQARRRRIQGHP